MKYLIQTKMSFTKISIQKLCIVFQRYIKEFNEDIKLRYIVVLGDGWDDASILCIWLKWNLKLKLCSFYLNLPKVDFLYVFV
jgi:hypothetical protein